MVDWTVAQLLVWVAVLVIGIVLIWRDRILRKRREPEAKYYTEAILEKLVVGSNPTTFEDLPVSTATGNAAWAEHQRYRDLLEQVRQGVQIPRSLHEETLAFERYTLAEQTVSGGGMHN